MHSTPNLFIDSSSSRALVRKSGTGRRPGRAARAGPSGVRLCCLLAWCGSAVAAEGDGEAFAESAACVDAVQLVQTWRSVSSSPSEDEKARAAQPADGAKEPCALGSFRWCPRHHVGGSPPEDEEGRAVQPIDDGEKARAPGAAQPVDDGEKARAPGAAQPVDDGEKARAPGSFQWHHMGGSPSRDEEVRALPVMDDGEKLPATGIFPWRWSGGEFDAKEPRITDGGAKYRPRKAWERPIPMTSANRPVTRWDMALFFCSLVAPCIVGLVFEMRTKDVSTTSDMYYMNRSDHADSRSDFSHYLLGGARNRDEPPEGTLLNNFLCGVAAAVCCLPQAIASSALAGVPPVSGIWAGFFMSVCTALVGGRPGMISCASASTAVILADVAKDPQLGLGGVAVVVVLCGALQATAGALRLARFASLVPHTVLLGFVNGLAVVVVLEQVNHFRIDGPRTPFLEGNVVVGMLLTALVSMVMAIVCPQLPVLGRFLPAPFAAILGSVVFGTLMGARFPPWTLEQVASADTFSGSLNLLPPWNFPPLDVDWGSWHLWRVAIPASLRMAIVGLVESLITLMVVDTVTDTRGSISRECFGQALGNVLSGIFGVQGGCALFCQTLLTVGAGARGRLSGLTGAAGLFGSIVLFAPLVAQIPVASVIGLMILVSARTFIWGISGFVRRSSARPVDGVVVMLVSVVGVCWDLATAVIIGLVVSVLAFAWSVSSAVRLEVSSDPAAQKRSFMLHGPLFFASSRSFQQRINVERILEAKVALDFTNGSVLDHAALEAVTKVVSTLKDGGKRVEIVGLSLQDQEYVYAMTGVATL